MMNAQTSPVLTLDEVDCIFINVETIQPFICQIDFGEQGIE